MRTKTKVLLIVATLLILIGGAIFTGVMTMLKWDFTKLSTVKYETNEYKITGEYKNISINTDTADIVFIPAENEEISVICYEQKNLKHTVTVKEEALVIDFVDKRKWYEHIGISFSTPKITLYIPEGEYGALSVKSSTGDLEIPKDYVFQSIDISQSTGDVDLYASAHGMVKIKTSTGDICVEEISATALELSVSTGHIEVSNIKCDGDVSVNVSTGRTKLSDVLCKSLVSGGNTGDITLSGVIASERFSITRSTGDIQLNECDAGEIYIKTDTGDVKGNLLSDKIFFAKTDTGKVNVPKSMTGGKCEIETDTGDIRFE